MTVYQILLMVLRDIDLLVPPGTQGQCSVKRNDFPHMILMTNPGMVEEVIAPTKNEHWDALLGRCHDRGLEVARDIRVLRDTHGTLAPLRVDAEEEEEDGEEEGREEGQDDEINESGEEEVDTVVVRQSESIRSSQSDLTESSHRQRHDRPVLVEKPKGSMSR
jgi:hypothetical protein